MAHPALPEWGRQLSAGRWAFWAKRPFYCREQPWPMITIRIPALWRPEAGASEVRLEADNVEGALRALVIRCPRLTPRLFDAHGGLNGSLHLFVNREALRFRGDLSAALNDGDEIYIAPMISGG